MAKTDVEFTFDQAVGALGLTPEKQERLIEEGKIPAHHHGIRTVIPRHAILDYLAEVSAVSLKDRKK